MLTLQSQLILLHTVVLYLEYVDIKTSFLSAIGTSTAQFSYTQVLFSKLGTMPRGAALLAALSSAPDVIASMARQVAERETRMCE